MVESLQISGYVCARCRTRYEQKVGTCCRCWESGVIIPDYGRRMDALVSGTSRRITARDLAAEDQTTQSLRAYPHIKVHRNSFGILHGGQGSGKTTELIRIAEGEVPAVFVAAEMKVGPALAGYLRRLEARSDKLEFCDPQTTDEIVELAKSGVRCLALDSLSVLSLLPEDCVNMARQFNVMVIGILQHCKDGSAAGSASWLHAADWVVQCESMKWKLEKSRFQAVDGICGDIL